MCEFLNHDRRGVPHAARALSAAVSAERELLNEWLSTSPSLLPSFSEWLGKHWLRFHEVTHGQFSDFGPVLKEVSEAIASTVACAAASC